MFYMRKTPVLLKAAAASAALIITMAALTGCADDSSSTAASTANSSSTVKAEDLDVGYDENSATALSFDGQTASVSGSGATADGAVITITDAGDYIVSGSSSDARLIIDADKEAQVRLLFKGVELGCEDNAPVLVKSADKVIITLDDGTQNTLSDGASYALQDDEKTDGCIFSKADLSINGSGSLTVNASYKHGIVTKDDLVIADGNISVSSASTALEGKDSVTVVGGTIKLDAGTNGVRTTNEEREDKGFITVTGGDIDITSGSEALEAVTFISVSGGNINAQAGGEISETETTGIIQADTESEGAIGFSAEGYIEITGGAVNISSTDDAFHTGENFTLSGAEVNVMSGDDAVHAKGDITILDGTLNISGSHEGLEALNVTIGGGEVTISSDDDCINCAGGSDSEESSGQEGVCLTVSGGTLTAVSNGDGLDSNGDILISGGSVYVSAGGSFDDSAIDFKGKAEITGGTLVACGMAAMDSGFADSSTQHSVTETMSEIVSGGTQLTVKDSTGAELVSFTPANDWQSIVYSAPGMQSTESYTVNY